MKWTILLAGSLCLLASCGQKKGPVVSATFVDSIITHYNNESAFTSVEKELAFWKDRIQPNSVDYVNSMKYAAVLVSRFHLSGNIHDLKLSDSVHRKLSFDLNGKEASPILALSRYALLQHRFREADSLFRKADSIGIKSYDRASSSFDINFETGRILFAESDIEKIAIENDFGYQFRRSKLMHYKGKLDSALSAMKKAADVSGNNLLLSNAALSNLADLYVHAGQLKKASETYQQCIRESPADLHSLMGLGRIALLADGNDSLAERIFRFVSDKTHSPDPLYQLIGVAEKRNDSALMKKYATAFVEIAADPAYGKMYNKYLVYLYAGILKDPAKAESLAEAELQNRNTPQTYAWFAYAQAMNGKLTEANAVYNKYVSGKPLEGMELYYMGKLMRKMGKNYNASQYFALADKNRYDLPAGAFLDLEKEISENW